MASLHQEERLGALLDPQGPPRDGSLPCLTGAWSMRRATSFLGMVHDRLERRGGVVRVATQDGWTEGALERHRYRPSARDFTPPLPVPSGPV